MAIATADAAPDTRRIVVGPDTVLDERAGVDPGPPPAIDGLTPVTADRSGRAATASSGPTGRLLRTATQLLRDERVLKWLRYGTVSAIASGLSLLVLAILVGTGATTAGWANVLATCAGLGPSFELNRRWVWRHDGPRSWHRQVVPFAAITFAGLGLSTLAVHATNGWALHAGLSTEARTAAVELANIAAFGSVWLVQFFVLDRYLFHRREPHRGPAEARAGSASHT